LAQLLKLNKGHHAKINAYAPDGSKRKTERVYKLQGRRKKKNAILCTSVFVERQTLYRQGFVTNTFQDQTKKKVAD
jgi:hypothetical protein